MARKGVRSKLLADAGTVISLLGAVRRKRGRVPDLLYSISRPQPSARTRNQIQFTAAILSQSKYHFFGIVLTILRFFSPERAELAYLDTDSVIWACSTWQIEHLVKSEYAHLWPEISSFLFEKDEPQHQAGKLKV